MIFGQKRERVVPDVPEEQMTLEGLFDTAGAKIPGFAESKETITYDRRKPKKGHGRKPIPDDLHREETILDVPTSEKVCSCCGSEKKKIGEDVSEELEYKPAVFYVNKFIRHKYACPKCPDNGRQVYTKGQFFFGKRDQADAIGQNVLQFPGCRQTDCNYLELEI